MGEKVGGVRDALMGIKHGHGAVVLIQLNLLDAGASLPFSFNFLGCSLFEQKESLQHRQNEK